MTNWYYAVDGVQYGPVTTEDLQRFLREKKLAHDDFVWNGAMPAWTEARNVPELAGGRQPLFAVGLPKLLVMTLGTFGVYDIYWFFKQWNAIRARTGEEMMPLARAIFAIFFFHKVVEEVNSQGRAHGIEAPLPVAPLTALFVLTTILWRLPDPWWLVSQLSVVSMLIVQARVNVINSIAAPLGDPNRRIRGWNWLAVILGVPLYAVIIVTMYGEL